MILDIVKFGMEITAGLGADTIARNAIKHITPRHLSKAEKVLVKVGTAVMSDMAACAAANHVEKAVNEITDQCNNILKKT